MSHHITSNHPCFVISRHPYSTSHVALPPLCSISLDTQIRLTTTPASCLDIPLEGPSLSHCYTLVLEYLLRSWLHALMATFLTFYMLLRIRLRLQLNFFHHLFRLPQILFSTLMYDVSISLNLCILHFVVSTLGALL